MTIGVTFVYTNSMEKEMKNVKRIFVDMDGVVADFLAGCSEMMGKPLTSDDAGHTEYDLRKEELTNKRLFGMLPPMVDYADLIGYIKHTGLPWEILTAAGTVNRELVVYDKNTWVRKYIDPTVVVTCTYSGSQKGAFAKKGFVLIDDRPKNIKAWEDNGGIGIVHESAEKTINILKELRNS